MTEPTTVLDFTRYILEQICENKSDISIEQTEDSLGTLLSVKVHESDMGKLIGKGGQTISALRLLVRTMGSRNGEKINLKVLDPVT
jgi:predicted RNA-binding protein YlqC (UPF0109 family)